MTIFRYYVASSADGFIADPADDIGWLLEFGMDEYEQSYARLMAATGALVMGSATYEFVASQDEPWPYDLPTWVLTSRRLPSIAGADIRFISGPIAEHLEAMRHSAQGRDVWIVGGGGVAAAFDEVGALDELAVTVMPVLLGDGKRLFAGKPRPRRLEHVSSKTYPSGAVENVYRVRARQS